MSLLLTSPTLTNFQQLIRTLKRAAFLSMNSHENDDDDDDDDDVEINPVTMLFLPEEQFEKVSPASQSDPSNLQLQKHQIHSIQSTVVIRQIPSEGLSFQLWPAATTLLSLLDHHRRDSTTSPLSSTLSLLSDHSRRLRILELGAGTGLVGIIAAATLSAEVTVTDLRHVLPNLRFNAESNSDVVADHGGAVVVAPLCWGEEDQMEAIGRDYDLILGSDVVYHDHLYDPLIGTLKYLLIENDGEIEKTKTKTKKKRKVRFVMAHLRRWKKESSFFKKAKKLFDVEIIHRDVPLNGSRIGVVVYRFAAKGP